MLKLEQLRQEIERIDAEIIAKLSVRQKLVLEIGALKAEAGKEVLDAARESQLRAYHERLCLEHRLEPEFVNKVFAIILDHSRKLQKNSRRKRRGI